MSELYGILPFLTDDDDVEMPVVEDVCHSYETIRRLVSVIQLRFYFTLGWKPSEGADSIVPTFDAIVGLIPEEEKTRAVERLDDKIWEWADLSLAAFNDILDKLHQVEEKRNRVYAEIDETQKSMERLIKNRQKTPPLAFPFASAGSPQVPAFPSQMLSPSSGNTVREIIGEKVFSLAAQAEKLEDEIFSYQTQERNLCRFAPVYSTLSTTLLEEKLGKDTAKALLDFLMSDPYEACFAFLYLLTKDDDRAWQYNFTLAVMNTACAHLPWAVGDYEEEG